MSHILARVEWGLGACMHILSTFWIYIKWLCFSFSDFMKSNNWLTGNDVPHAENVKNKWQQSIVTHEHGHPSRNRYWHSITHVDLHRLSCNMLCIIMNSLWLESQAMLFHSISPLGQIHLFRDSKTASWCPRAFAFFIQILHHWNILKAWYKTT